VAVVAAAVIVAGATLAGSVFAAAEKYDSNVSRIDAFKRGDTERQARPRPRVDGPLTFLVVGSDSRAQDSTDAGEVAATGGQRTDTIMLVHLQSDQESGYVVSIPRDTFVDIPPGGSWNGGKGKINAAFQFGGIPQLVETIEDFTEVRIDHVVVIDFKGLERVVDAVGGIDVTVTESVRDSQTKAEFTEGVNHLDGKHALDYVRQRYGLPEGDFDRIDRQQNFLRAMMAELLSRGTLANPFTLSSTLKAVVGNLTVDEAFDTGEIRGLAVSLRGLRTGDVTFVTAPFGSFDTTDAGASIVRLDERQSDELWEATGEDRIGDYLDEYGTGAEQLPAPGEVN